MSYTAEVEGLIWMKSNDVKHKAIKGGVNGGVGGGAFAKTLTNWKNLARSSWTAVYDFVHPAEGKLTPACWSENTGHQQVRVSQDGMNDVC